MTDPAVEPVKSAEPAKAVAVVVEQSALELALDDARVMIEKIKVTMAKIYYIFTKDDIQKGLLQVPDVIKSALQTGVNVIVKVIEKIMKGMEYIHTSGYVLIALVKELPNMVDAAADLLDPDTARSARRSASIAAFTAVFVDEKYADVQKMLTLFAKLLEAVAGKPDAAYKPGVALGLSAGQLGFDPAVGPKLPTVAPVVPALPAST